MTVVLFTAQWVDWSGCAVNETGCGEKRYTIYTDGTVENGIVRASLSPEAFARLKELFSGDFCHAITHRDAYDGDGWSMTLYAGNGHIIHETGLGYIYGVPVLGKRRTIHKWTVMSSKRYREREHSPTIGSRR